MLEEIMCNYNIPLILCSFPSKIEAEDGQFRAGFSFFITNVIEYLHVSAASTSRHNYVHFLGFECFHSRWTFNICIAGLNGRADYATANVYI